MMNYYYILNNQLLIVLIYLRIIYIIALILLLGIYTIYKWFACKNTAEKIRLFSLIQSIFIILELIGLSTFIVFNLLDASLPNGSNYTNITSSSNFKDFILTDPTVGISVLIGSISIIIIYLYFFNVLRQTKYFSENSEVQKKYSSIFWSFIFFLFLGSIVVLTIDSKINAEREFFDSLLFFIGMVNLGITLPLAYNLKYNFFNSNIPDSKNLKIDSYDYKFIEDFRKLKEYPSENLIGDFILILTLLWAGLVLLINCNIFFLIVIEFSLLLALFWSSQLRLIPKKKTTIELKNKDNSGKNIIINDVFVLSESSKEYIVILDNTNQISHIMKDSIQRFFVQKE
jgi:hypothetical protein